MDYGGSVGPEGSLLCFVVIAVMWVAFEKVYPDVKYRALTEKSLTQRTQGITG